ncbi:MAG: MFS transporter [SAR202 cluster bacterium Io17-Chloro-G2]|nr:MAG: MFS transporter [SAR202 cluster bacterium Io17-Chloro-G2]
MSEERMVVATEQRDIRMTGRFMITGLAAGHSVFHWVMQSFVVVLPEIQAAFQLSAVGVGGILTSRELASGIIRLPGGVVADVLRRHWGLLLAGCILVAGLGSLAMGVSLAYPLLLAGMALVAMAHALWHLPASASLSYHFPEKRGLALAFHGVGGSVGDVAGPLATGALLMVLGWQGILSLYAIVPVFLAFLAVWSFQNIGRVKESDEKPGAQPSRAESTKRLLTDPVLWGITVVRGFRAMSLVALVTVLPLYLADELQMSPFARGFHIGLLIAIGLVAKPLAGHLSDRWGRKQVLVPGLVWSCALALLLIPFNQGIGLTVTIALLGLFLYPDQPILTAATLEIVGRDVSATALGIATFASFIMSAASPLIAGGLYQSVGMDPTLYFIAALFAAGAVIFALLPLAGRDQQTSNG